MATAMTARELCNHVVAKLNEAAGAAEFSGPNFHIYRPNPGRAAVEQRALGEVHSGVPYSTSAYVSVGRRRYPIAADGSFNVAAAVRALREAATAADAADRAREAEQARAETAKAQLSAQLGDGEGVWIEGPREITYGVKAGTVTATAQVDVATDGSLRVCHLAWRFDENVRALSADQIGALVRAVAIRAAEGGLIR